MRHHMTVDGPIPFTPEEEAARDLEEAQVLADKPRQDALAEISRLEGEVTNRRLREALADPTWINSQEALIAIERAKL